MSQASRLLQRNKLLEEAQDSVQGEQALVEYLSSEHDIDFIKEMLRPLDPSLIPSGSLQFGIRLLRSKEYKNALKALGDLATFFKCLSRVPPSDSVTAYTDVCLTVLIDTWLGVTKWISYCFMHSHMFTGPTGVGGMCAVLLIGVTNSPSGPRGALREELALMTCTIDILFILLGETDRTTGEYFILRWQDHSCPLMQALRVQLNENPGLNAIKSRLLTVRKKTRRAAIASLVDRAPLLIATARASTEIIGLAKTLEHVIDCLTKLGASSGLWKEMTHQGFGLKQTLALAGFAELGFGRNITDQEFWTPIANATVTLAIAITICDAEPGEAFVKMFEAGFFMCIVRCLPYFATGSSLPFAIMQPYMHGRKVIEALCSKRGGFEKFLECRGLSEGVEAVCHVFEVKIAIAREVYISRAAVPIPLCSNFNHSSSRPSCVEEGNEPLKACSTCRAVFYCSTACQKEDWDALHRQECCTMTQQRNNRRSVEATLRSIQTKREQLSYLKYALDSDLRIIHGKPATRKRLGESLIEAQTICVLDFSNCPTEWPEDGSDLELDFFDADGEWAQRIEKCISDTELELLVNPGQVFVFVEGVFSLDQFRRTCIFVKMRKDPNTPKEYQWKVGTSVFRGGKQAEPVIADL